MDLEKLAEKAKAGLPKAEPAKKVESKDATSASSAETKKTKEEEQKVASDKVESKVKEAEEKAKKDEEILSTEEGKLDEEGKKRKAELVKVKADAEEKEKKSNVQKRFDELTSKIKKLEESEATTRAEKEAEKAEKEAAKTELESIKKQLSMTSEDKIKEKVKSETLERRKKYIEEDIKLPKEDRREMSKEEIDEWLIEDYEGATEWIQRRTIRRVGEESYLRQQELTNSKAKDLKAKQKLSADRAFAKHPELNFETRLEELKKQGKSKEEAKRIIGEENPKVKLAFEILEANPDKYILAENGPELIAEEVEKRLNKKPEVDTEKEELKARLAKLEAENETLKNLDSGISSTRHAEHKETETDIEKEQGRIAKKLGIDPEDIKKRVKERKEKGYDN
jgi:hypothetical protein